MNRALQGSGAMTDMSNTDPAAMPLTGIGPCPGCVVGVEHGTLLKRIGRRAPLRLAAGKINSSVSTDAMPPTQWCLK